MDYRTTLELHLAPFFGDYMLSQIGPGLIERYIAEKVADRKAGEARVVALEEAGAKPREIYEAKRERGLSNRAINKTLTRLSQVMDSAVREQYVQRNPVEHVRRLTAAKRVKPFLQLDQINPLLDAVEGDDNRALIETLLLAGLRIGEALGLRWGDIDLLGDPPRITVKRTLYGKHEGPVKTGEEGTVTFGPRLLGTLLDHKARSPYQGDDELVFSTRRPRSGREAGNYLNPSNVRGRVLSPAVERANQKLALKDRPLIPADLTPHRLRDTFCSLLIAQGEDVATVAAQMRHSDPTTTLRVYTRYEALSDGCCREA